MNFPEPVIGVAIEPKTKADEEKLGPRRCRSCAEEDPDLPGADRRGHGADDHRRHGRAAPGDPRRPDAAGSSRSRPTWASPRSPTRRRSARGGRRGQLRAADRRSRAIRPRRARRSSRATEARGSIFEDATNGRRDPEGIRLARSRRASREAMEAGVLAGLSPDRHPGDVSSVAACHEVDSSEMAFKVAGGMALKDATTKARPVLLEPVMNVEIVTPPEYMGDVNGRPRLPAGERLREWSPGETPRVLAAIGAAGGDVRLRDTAAITDPGSRGLHDGVCSIRARSQAGGRENHARRLG